MTDGKTQQPDKSDAFGVPQPDPNDRLFDKQLEVIGQMQAEIDRLRSERDNWKNKAQYFYKEREAAWEEVRRIQPMIDSRFIKGEEEIRLLQQQRLKAVQEQQEWEARKKAIEAMQGEARAVPLSWSQLWRDFKCLVSLP